MDKKKTALRAGAVLVVALAAGHLAQTLSAERTSAKAEPKAIEQVSAGAEKAPPVTNPVIPSSASLGTASLVPAPAAEPATVTMAPPAPAPAEKPVLAALTEAPKAAPAAEPPVLPEMGDAAKADPAPAPALAAPALAATECAVDMKLTAGPQAMISIALTAPCRAGERVVLRHAGLAIAETLSETGTLLLDLPALNTAGEVSALFPDAEIARSAVAVPDAATVHRFAVQWMADDAFQLHAMENGADYGQPGHVSADQPVSSNGGYLMALGNPTLDLPMMAQVYTWPSNSTIPADVVIEAAVTESTCGRELLGETISVSNGAATITDLTLATPDCDAIGDILVLKNPGTDVTLAASN